MVLSSHIAAFIRRLLLLACCVLLLQGCAGKRFLLMQRQSTREEALKKLDEGQRLESEGALILALERYNQAALIYETPEAYFKMGQLFETQGKTQEAATAYSHALELSPDYQEARLSLLALGYQPKSFTPTADDLARAQEWGARRATEIATLKASIPVDADAAETTSTEPDLKGQRMEIIDEAAQKRLPTATEVSATIFAPEADDEKLPSATKPVYANDQDIILATYPYHYQKAQALRKRQLYDRAAEEYKSAIQADPKKIEARLELGDMLMRMNLSARAMITYEKAMQDFPENPQPYFKLGRYYAEVKQPERAREFYRQAIAKDPKYTEAHNNIAVMEMEAQHYDVAGKMFDEIIKLDPNYANAYLNRGIIADENEKNKDLALRCYRRYVELNGTRAAQVRSWINEMENEEK